MNKRSFLTFLIFLALSTALWLLIKLSEEYNTQTTFLFRIEGVPADKWIAAPEQTAKFSMTTDGFHTLQFEMIREVRRCVSVHLDEVPYRLENGNTYSFSSQYVAEKIAKRLNIDPSDISMNDAMVYFTMDAMKSKTVPVVLRSELKTQRQYDVYGQPALTPATVTVYGPEEVLDTLKAVKTVKLHKIGLSENFSESVPLDLPDGLLQSEVSAVKVDVEVERFTETDVLVPLVPPDSLRVRFFPEAVTVKCLVAIRDYADLAPDLFRVECDRQQFDAHQPLLDVRLVEWPQPVQVLDVKPDKVEYLIVQ